jgi:hypothetical protein
VGILFQSARFSLGSARDFFVLGSFLSLDAPVFFLTVIWSLAASPLVLYLLDFFSLSLFQFGLFFQVAGVLSVAALLIDFPVSGLISDVNSPCFSFLTHRLSPS